MFHKYFSSVFAVCVVYVCLAQAQVQEGTPCETPNKEYGQCINVYNCKVVTDLLSSNNLTPERKNFIRSLSCGYKSGTPLVCCPQQNTRSPIQPVPVNEENLPDDKETNNFSEVFLSPPACGASQANLPKVVGGVDAKLGEFPWIAALGYRNSRVPSQPRWLCGGTLITYKHILTAGHCVHNRNDLYLARLGELDLFNNTDGAQPVDIPLASAKVHEDYSPTKFTSDIAVLTLSRSAENINRVWPICLPWDSKTRTKTFLGNTPLVAGWGAVYFNGPTSSILKVAALPVVHNNRCETAFAARAVIDERILCAEYPNGAKDACQGDSGGPLMHGATSPTEKFPRYYLIGIVSYGFRCAEPGYPGVYTRVTHFLNWIARNVQ